jgi:HEAT repeat protein
MAHALFDGARRTPNWQYAVAIHRLAAFLGRYWSEISKGAIKDPRVLESVYACLPMMPDVERWMAGPGRDVLLATVNDADEMALTAVVKVLGELREPRAISALLKQLEQTQVVQSREQALYLGSICDALGRLGDLRATTPLLQLLARVVPTSNRIGFDKRRDNLPIGDPNIPASIIYAAVIRACGQLGDINALDTILRATHDFDPYVRLQAIEALKRIDPRGEDAISRMTGREALNDPRDTVVRAACQLVIQYHDTEAVAVLQQIIQTQPELAPAAYDALRQLGR